MDSAAIAQFSQKMWNDSIVPALMYYIRIPAKSPMFDPDWEEIGHIERAVDLVEQWCRENGPAEMKIEVVRLPGRTPVILMEIAGDGEEPSCFMGTLISSRRCPVGEMALVLGIQDLKRADCMGEAARMMAIQL